MAAPKALIVPAVTKQTATVIMAHGLGDTGHGWADLAQNWRRRSKFMDVEFIFPHAPTIPITVNMGVKMPGWYDIRNFTDLTAAQDTLGIRSTKQAFHTLIDNQISSSVPPERIIIGGFSQGGSIALLAGLSYPKRLGGVFAMSSYLLMGDGFRAEIPLANVNGQTPLWMGHGKADPLVKYEWGVLTREKLKGWGYESEWKDYDGMGHSACPEEISDLEAFLTRLLQ